MAAVSQLRLSPMTEASLDAVLAIEQQAYSHPWTRRNFADALQAGYESVLLCSDDEVLGYFVVMPGVEEAHLLNLAVATDARRQGLAKWMLEAVALWALRRGARHLWLEVRTSNAAALGLYQSQGFRVAGRRKAYYPAGQGQREDALVMSRPL
jgi:ribosomal-protein-alanine N-acetyltransferase